MRLSLRYAILFTLVSVSEASAQTAVGTADDFSGLRGRATIAVVDDSGNETRGELRSFTPDQLTMTVNGREIVFDRQNVNAVFQHGDSLKNGIIIGSAAGWLWGLGVTYSSGLLLPGGATSSDLTVPVFFGMVGLAIGTVIDKLIIGRRPLYGRPKPAAALRISLVPLVARSGMSLQTSVSW